MNRPNPREHGQRGRVLLLDDDEPALDGISALLVQGGYEVLPQRTPIGVTQRIARENVSAVIVDMTSPMMQGARFSALLASWERVRDVPVVLITEQPDHETVAHMKRVFIALKGKLEHTLLRTVERAVAMRAASPSHSGMQPVRPTVRHFARSALDTWRAFMQARGVSLPTVLAQLVTLRSEMQAIGLEQSSELVTLAIELAKRTDVARSVTPEADHSLTALLEWLMTLEPDKGLAFERSVTLTMHRARLEEALAR